MDAILDSSIVRNVVLNTLVTVLIFSFGWVWVGASWKSSVDIKLNDLEIARTGFDPLRIDFKEMKKKALEIEPVKADIAVIKNDIGHIKDSIKALDKKFDEKFNRLDEKMDKGFNRLDEKIERNFDLLIAEIRAINTKGE